ncbi:MAG: Nif3-like dinuclear metal center hexameric protein [Gammaproteobacteria bacterium]|jgi:dinuclear metal center YbgI/SA1388 family protein|nr:Nif3-like dinuclear metal center hexameric protein [Gammaproteobacteria bacterium]MBT3859928.1 Nif3-like dinuclear metal center hexameric protein [Gammaproteobacteria bacterium]MBT3986390.1 Nif3-like dinuclear metal center hexameric protein [Gammaproteobacteria bacterium]MBT4255017.1 Nif3-like dinuclear metal center hexameric protein [Gammaproteobacteria bacterium]MBT4582950.1 Nif3-like dinuclear metal center hexameric protein [Gammaproteobacteria bacterium]
MPISLNELESELKTLLRPEQFNDYCPNGMQVEGRKEVSKIVSGVTACRALIEAAQDNDADVLLVHHGYFWKGEDQTITGLKKGRIEKLLESKLSLLAYHLPLDVHQDLGNNSQLGKLLGFKTTGELGKRNNHPMGLTGELAEPLSCEALTNLLRDKLGRDPLVVAGTAEKITSVAWCTGAAQDYIQLAIDKGIDAYITGEVSESTFHMARESGIHFFSAGHHATERYGVQAVGEYLAEKFGIEHQFIDIDNPV